MGHDTSDGLPPGHRIGRYRIDRELGRGGFGITYRATDLDLDRPVAIKEYFPREWVLRSATLDVMARSGWGDEFDQGLGQFRNEAKILARVTESGPSKRPPPNIVGVYRYLEQHDTGYIIMEFIDGEPLSERLKRQATLGQADIEQFVLPILDGLSAVHEKGVYHRDVSPKNIMLAEGGTGVLIDFGSARPRKRAESGEATIMYTPGYAAIEQLRGEPESAATDIYGLGAVLYRCVSGNPPCDPRERERVDRMPRASDAEHQHVYRPGLLRMIDSALAVQPEERPQSIADWQGLLGGSDESEARSASRRVADGSERSDHELAEEGDADTQYRRGLLYAEGDDAEGAATRRDDVEAKFWFRMAAAQGHPRAQYRLHRMYEDGEGGEQDRSAAAEWETKAWQTDAENQCSLAASCREQGADDEAEFWYRGAARRGDVNARFKLGAMYWGQWVEGRIVDAGVEVSLRWCEQRVAEGSTWAGVFLAGAIDVGIAGGQRKFLDAEAEMRRLRTWRYDDPREPLGAQYDADCAKFCLAYKYLRMAARQGHPEAREYCDRLGVFMLKHALTDRGWHGAFLTDLAVETMTNADDAARCLVDDGEVLDRFRLGARVAYETIRAGRLIGDYESAVTERLGCSKEDIRPYLRCWLTAARELLPDHADGFAMIDSEDVAGMRGNADYQYERGLLAHYENDFEEAESWYTQAADQGHAKAQFDLGMMFFHREIEGLSVGECVEHALSYCIDAERSGLECAKAFLDRDIQCGLEAYRRGDHYEAELEFRRLAELGRSESAEAQFRLAQMCVQNNIICTDCGDRERFDQACEWLRAAARNGCGRAESRLCGLLDGHAGSWFDEGVHLEDRVEALDWYRKAAERPPAEQYALGLRSEGDPYHADREEASFWHRLAADQGHVNAQFHLGLLAYLGEDDWHGDGPPWLDEDDRRTYWLCAAAHNGHQIAHALVDADPETPATSGGQTSLFDAVPPFQPNVAFPAFAEEMQAESEACVREPRLLRALYRTYRQAAGKAGVRWAGDFSTDSEIDAWYARME